MSFGFILKKLRTQNQITCEQLGNIINVPKSTIANWETERNYPNKDKLVELANYFGCSVDYLLERTDDPRPASNIKEGQIVYIGNLKKSQQEIIKGLIKEFTEK